MEWCGVCMVAISPCFDYICSDEITTLCQWSIHKGNSTIIGTALLKMSSFTWYIQCTVIYYGWTCNYKEVCMYSIWLYIYILSWWSLDNPGYFTTVFFIFVHNVLLTDLLIKLVCYVALIVSFLCGLFACVLWQRTSCFGKVQLGPAHTLH